jgi:hypothetical protein
MKWASKILVISLVLSIMAIIISVIALGYVLSHV